LGEQLLGFSIIEDVQKSYLLNSGAQGQSNKPVYRATQHKKAIRLHLARFFFGVDFAGLALAILPSFSLKRFSLSSVSSWRAACLNFLSWFGAFDMAEYISFSDESCITAHDYMIIGGVLCRDDCAQEIVARLSKIHPTKPDHWAYEWKNIREKNADRYHRFVELFFEYNREHCLDFACLVIDCRNLDHKRFNDGDGDKGFNKFLYQHLLKHSREMGETGKFRCYHDQRSSKYDLDEIRSMLNFKSFQADGRFVHRYRELAYADKRNRPMLQFADVILGAVGFAWNRKAEQNPVSAKAIIADEVRKGANVASLATRTWMSEKHFSIWEFGLS
jgi:hypothetical protein